MLNSKKSVVEVRESELTIATRAFVRGEGVTKYLEQLQILANQPNTGQDEFQRGVQEGMRRAYLNLINSINRK